MNREEITENYKAESLRIKTEFFSFKRWVAILDLLLALGWN